MEDLGASVAFGREELQAHQTRAVVEGQAQVEGSVVDWEVRHHAVVGCAMEGPGSH